VKDTAIRRLGEAGRLQFRAEAFDIFNHPNFSLPNQTVATGSCTAAISPDPNLLAGCPISVNSGAGTITSTVGNSGALPGGDRQIQFGLKLIF
jgi:hypothetical protein